eukprot:TRINITY_DN2279_c0_g3_i1.p1 TRINITY_DN2279_c0_g3~~TRINITY_DN2279_c0_g3_i1.p1  ORF type:complete len:510 (-),score=88.72 TRINITY_DN2279_c0_g3_i1:243-1772(-)
MKPIGRPININASAKKINVDNRIPLHFYYRIANNLLKQASIYREEKNLIDLYIILLRYSSLVSETIPFHRDYQSLLPKERLASKKKLLDAVSELESLKPVVQHQVNESNTDQTTQLNDRGEFSNNSAMSYLEWAPVNKQISLNPNINQPDAPGSASPSSWMSAAVPNQVLQFKPFQVERQFQKLSLSVPQPKEETLTRHSILGPNGLRGQWLGPTTGIRVQYPSNADLTSTEISSQNQDAHHDSGGDRSAMDSVLSLDDGRWLRPAEESCSPAVDMTHEDILQLSNIRQPLPPPVLARVEKEVVPIPPSKVADPRPGPARSSPDGICDSKTYQHLHIPPKMMEEFLRLAQSNTAKNLETCGILSGSLKDRMFYITTLIIPKQESTSDSCQTTNEEEIFDVQDKLSLFPLGWIHTHPSQTCFMSSVDLHTHYSYQVMLPEAVAIVMAPTDTTRTHGIFHLSDPAGVSVIRNCQERGFHPHEEPVDGCPIYEHCSHVYMNLKLKFKIIDLR